MVDLDPIVDRLKANCPLLRQVGGSATLDACVKASRFTPDSAFVLPGLEGPAGENELGAGGFRQLVPVQFSVAYYVRNVADARGAGLHGALRPIREQAIDTLIDWAPAWAVKPIEFFRGRPGDMEPGFMWWEDFFRTEYFLEK